MADLTERAAPLGRHALSGLARGSALNLVGAAVSTFANTALVVIVTRGVDVTLAGIFFTITSAFLLATTIARAGTNTALVYFISKARATGSDGDVGRYMRMACVPVSLLALLMSCVLAYFAGPLSDTLLPGHTEVATKMLQVLAVALPAGVLHEVFLAGTRGFRRMAPTVLVESIALPLTQGALLAAVIAFGWAGAWLIVAWTVPYGFALAAGWWAWRRLRPSAEASAASDHEPQDADAPTVQVFWRFAGPRALSSIAQLAMARADILLVAAIRGPKEAVIYTAATRFVVVGQLGTQAVNLTLQPRIAALTSTNRFASASHMYRVATTWLILLNWPLYLVSAIFAHELLLVFGRQYTGGQAVVIIMAAAMLLATASGMVDVYLNMSGKSTWTLQNAFLALSTMVGVDLLFIPPYGAMGAAIGWASAIVVRNGSALLMLRRAFGLKPFGPAFLVATGVSLLCFFIMPLTAAALSGGSVAGRLVGVGVGLACWVGVVLRLRSVLYLGHQSTGIQYSAETPDAAST